MFVSVLVSENASPLNGFVHSHGNPQKPRRKDLMGTELFSAALRRQLPRPQPEKEVQWEHDKFLKILLPLQEWLPRKHDNICF